ncbi:conserved domain protein [Peptoniphilus sp. oral taxon 375 str. F0436]|nr:conserved domain protein [Peptoniphilus sp. oral taxon 375 str. F0436]
MNKKFLSLVLALVMVLGTFGSVFAETKAPEAKDAKKSEVKVPEKKDSNEKVQWLVDNEVVAGRTVNKDDKNADLALDKNIQRAEVTKLLIYAIGQQDLAKRLDGVYAPYKDVPSNHWANGLIAAGSTVASPANALPFLHGVGHNMFEPERQVRYDELAKMLVVLVKEDLTKAGLEAAKWPTDWMNWAAKLGIFDGIKTPVDGSKYAVREDAFVMLYNALYKIGGLRNLPAGETMGIISDATANKIVLNQGDFKKEFTVSYNTNFVPGDYQGKTGNGAIEWNKLAKDGEYFIGSLVRVIADDKGNVSHIVQLGNPEKLALESQGWVAVAEKTVEGKALLGDLSKITFNKTNTVYTNSKTRYFAADYKNNQLTEVKDKAAALALFDNDTKVVEKEKVYVGYDVLANSGRKEAKVVVFNKVDKDNNDSTLIRVTTAPTNNYKVYGKMSGYFAPETKGYDVKGYKDSFPINYDKIQEYDVVELYNDYAKRLIDFDEDPVYEVTAVNKEQIKKIDKVNGRKIELTLKDINKDTKDVDIVADADLFFGSEIEKGMKVQVQWVNDKTQNAVDIVSVVPKSTPLKGALKDATPYNQVEGTVTAVATLVGEKGQRITITDKDGVKHGPYLVDQKDLTIKEGDKVKVLEFEGPNEDHKLPLATKVVIVREKAKLDKAITEVNALANLSKDQKDAFVDRLNKAEDNAEVAKIEKEAKATDALEAAEKTIKAAKGLGVAKPATAQKVMDAVKPLVTSVNVAKVESKPDSKNPTSYDITLEKDGQTKVVNVTVAKAEAAK